jgi:hypothetical protein
VFRALLAALILCLSFELSGLAATLGEPAIDNDECPADASGGECAPNCDLCACCSLPRVAPSATACVAPAAATGRSHSLGIPEMPASPEPADILHVPKPLLA